MLAQSRKAYFLTISKYGVEIFAVRSEYNSVSWEKCIIHFQTYVDKFSFSTELGTLREENSRVSHHLCAVLTRRSLFAETSKETKMFLLSVRVTSH